MNLKKTKHIFLFILGLLFCAYVQSQSRFCIIDTSEIVWQANVLSWSDFTKVDKLDTSESAMSVTKIWYCFSYRNDTVFFRTLSLFSKAESWRTDYQFDNFDLRHEQLHFDITEYFRRKFWREVNSTCKNEMEISIIYRRIISECDLFQNLYDFETNHSINKAKQTEWDMKVCNMLQKMEYSNKEVPISNPICNICWTQ